MLDMSQYVLLDGVSSIDKGLALSDVSPLILPNRSRNREPRYGNLTAVESSYWKHQPATIKLPFIIEGTGKDDIINKYQALSDWFLKASELRIWYDLSKYYLGSVEGDVEFGVMSRRYGRLAVPFVCNPPCWNKVRSIQAGWKPSVGTPIPEQITDATETISRVNAGNLPSVTYEAAHPAALYFTITGTWTALAIGGATGLVINYTTPQSMTLYIDCDAQEIYHKLGGVMTAVPYSGDFPTLESTSAIAVAGTNLAATTRMLVIERG